MAPWTTTADAPAPTKFSKPKLKRAEGPAITTVFNAPQKCKESRLTILKTDDYRIWLNHPEPVRASTVGECYPSQFLQSFSSMRAGATPPAFQQLACPDYYQTVLQEDSYIACCPSGFKLHTNEAFPKGRPAFKGTCYSDIKEVIVTAYDESRVTATDTWRATADGAQAYAYPLEGYTVTKKPATTRKTTADSPAPTPDKDEGSNSGGSGSGGSGGSNGGGSNSNGGSGGSNSGNGGSGNGSNSNDNSNNNNTNDNEDEDDSDNGGNNGNSGAAPTRTTKSSSSTTRTLPTDEDEADTDTDSNPTSEDRNSNNNGVPSSPLTTNTSNSGGGFTGISGGGGGLASSQESKGSESKSGLSGGTIAGLVIGILGVIGLFAIVFLMLKRRRDRHKGAAEGAGGATNAEKGNGGRPDIDADQSTGAVAAAAAARRDSQVSGRSSPKDEKVAAAASEAVVEAADRDPQELPTPCYAYELPADDYTPELSGTIRDVQPPKRMSKVSIASDRTTVAAEENSPREAEVGPDLRNWKRVD